MSINRVNISGNLTRDPELRATAGGTQVLSFGVAVNDRRKNPQTGDWEDYPNFVDCTMFGTRAEAVSRYLSKGTKVAIEGKLRYSSWDKDGQRRSKLEVVVDEIEFMSSRQHAEQGNPPYVAERPQAAPQAYAPQPAPQWSAQQAYRNPPATTPQRPQAPAPAPQAVPQACSPQPVQPELYAGDIPF